MRRRWFSHAACAGLFCVALAFGQSALAGSSAAARFNAEILPVAGTISSFCAAIAEGRAPSEDVFGKNGFKRLKSNGRPIYSKEVYVGNKMLSIAVFVRKNGCLIVLPYNTAVDAVGFYARAKDQLVTEGYQISKAAGGQNASKATTNISLKMKPKGNSMGSAMHFTMMRR